MQIDQVRLAAIRTAQNAEPSDPISWKFMIGGVLLGFIIMFVIVCVQAIIEWLWSPKQWDWPTTNHKITNHYNGPATTAEILQKCEIRCDWCGKLLRGEAEDELDLARSVGWMVREEKAFCGSCSSKV